MKDDPKKIIYTLLPLLILVISTIGFAEINEIIAEGTYNMGDSETPSVAESRAILNAKRTALEQAGTYIESYSKVENLQLVKDEVQVLAVGIMEVTVLDKKRTVVGNGIHFWVKIKAKIRTDKIKEVAKRLREKTNMEDYKNVLAAYDQSQKEIEQLKKQLAKAKPGKKKNEIIQKIENDERLFQAAQWFEKALQYENKEYDAMIEALTSAIALNPNYIDAYILRCVAYHDKQDFDRAIKDCTHAILTMQNHPISSGYAAFAYATRGSAYYFKGQINQAINDFNRAIITNPNISLHFVGRGLAYEKQDQHDKALADYGSAITLDSKNATAFYFRGGLYTDKKLHNEAIADYDQAIAIGFDKETLLAEVYCDRGVAYFYKGYSFLAIDDLTKSINLDRNISKAHIFRGIIHYNKKDFAKALVDFNHAIDLKPNDRTISIAYYMRALIHAKIFSNTRENIESVLRDEQTACELGYQEACDVLTKFKSR
jgi:tetratricopeptide (TPR) repeat protein